MWQILLFRVLLLSGFLFAVWKWGDWRNWRKYYPSMLFVSVVNLTVAFLLYHHPLWLFKPDILASTHTVVELFNAYLVLPATTLLFLANLPAGGRGRQYAYLGFWVLIYGAIEGIDSILGGISYYNGWSYSYSVIFDCVMFAIIRIHYEKPLLAWLISMLFTVFIVFVFDIFSAEMK